MRKRIKEAALLAGMGALLFSRSFWQTQARSEDIRHYTAFFAVEGTAIDEDNELKQLIAEKIGAECEETWLVGQTKENALNNYIASGKYPDFISGETQLYEAGVLIPIDEYWDDYPNIRNYLTDEQWERFRQDDGHIYWIPQFGVTHGPDIETTHSGEAFWIQTRVLKWAGYPQIHTVEEYFDLLEQYIEANPFMEDGTKNIPFTLLCDDWRYFCLENVPQFLDGYSNDGSCIVDPDTFQVVDYNTTDTAKRYFKKLNEEYQKGIFDPESFTETYDDYINKLSTGAVLGMVDQWWEFFYAIQTAYEEKHLYEQGCDYVPLPITMENGVKNQWHTARSAELDNSSGLAITVSCQDIEGAMQFVSDLLEPEIQKLRFWGEKDVDYSVDGNGLFYMTEEQGKRRMDQSLEEKHFCMYSYFPRVEGYLPDGINAFSMETQPSEFIKHQPQDIQECFEAYGVTNYVDMIGSNASPGSWFPMYSYTKSISSNSKIGQIKNRMDAVKHEWLPQIIMADDYETAWQSYMQAYANCEPELYFDELQKELDLRIHN